MLLQKLANDWGYSSPEGLFEEYVFDSVSPGICINAECGYSTEVEPDQEHGWCENCGTNTVTSAFILGGLI